MPNVIVQLTARDTGKDNIHKKKNSTQAPPTMVRAFAPCPLPPAPCPLRVPKKAEPFLPLGALVYGGLNSVLRPSLKST